ncbi:MAG: hypothetical protein ACFB22_00265 [Rhodothalassiaceae bacterium]
MEAETLIFLIPIVAIIFGVTADYLKNRDKLRAESAANAEASRRIDQLEERVRVLERIATDRGYDLREEINALGH